MRYWFLPATLVILGLLSVLTLSSIAPELASRQLIFFLLGGGVFFSISRLSWKQVTNASVLGYVLTVFLLILTLVVATQTRNTARWIHFGSVFSLQPSQLAIPLVGLYISSLVAHSKNLTLRNILTWAGVVLVPGVLILVQPNLGTTTIYLASLALLVSFLPVTRKQILSMFVIGCATVLIAWLFILKPYQKQRITSFMSPSADSAGANYNAQQSMIAVGSGQFWGRGLGQGVQSHLRFLPERQTDFIFASIAEEFGFIGSVVVISIYTGILLFLLRAAQYAQSDSARYFIYIITAQIAIQTSVNIGMNVGLVPITGVTLPLLSYGGSSVLTLCATFGLLQTEILSQKKHLTLHVS